MSKPVSFLFRRLFLAFFIIIILSIFLSTFLEFFITRDELPHLLTRIRTEYAAGIIGALYSQSNSWESLEEVAPALISRVNYGREDNLALRMIVKDTGGSTVYNSFADLTVREEIPLIEGETVEIFTPEDRQLLGRVTLYMSRDYLDRETGDYILSLLKPRLTQGIILLFALLLTSVLLSRRISKPISALTRAAGRISSREESAFLPVETRDELGEMSKAFNKMMKSLQTQRELRTRLIGDISHEIMTPLNNIRLEAKGLSDGLTTVENASSHIMEEIDKLGNIIHDLDWLGETDSGEFHLEIQQENLDTIIREEIERWQPRAEGDRQILTYISPEEKLPDLNLDKSRIGQVLGNLIGNALKYTPAGGVISVGLYELDKLPTVCVSDTGPGVKEEELMRLFNRFYRVEHTESDREGVDGRGLGLAIARKIVEMHGGRIWAENGEEQGCCFYFQLPLGESIL